MKKIITVALLIGPGLASLGFGAEAHADNPGDFLDAAHGSGHARNVLVVPGGDAELVSLAKIACTTYEAKGGMAAISAVRAAEPNITFAHKDPMLMLDAPTKLENFAVTYYCPWV